ncbi:hypothetical protein Mnod_1626 [Methylobacterium nodulans ORS 2060]|uniref:Uncharacterized protein n=1 Tax=Methylobacterium nodulans (strain LMG 21967 / CNCM I-2342 / ORS 2060) TaxID=460265 RepID=B8IPW6_METNO|nr:hypothetical protein Mnod_1626 [Methylobacterium nodulans ORS 2060]
MLCSDDTGSGRSPNLDESSQEINQSVLVAGLTVNSFHD